jgi:hypothetical protein
MATNQESVVAASWKSVCDEPVYHELQPTGKFVKSPAIWEFSHHDE